MREKKKWTIAIVLIVLLGILVFAIVKSSSGKSFTVSFNTHGGTEIKTLNIKKGETIEEPEAPSKEGYEFIGWYYDGEKFDFKKKIDQNIKLDAKWLKVGTIKNTVTFDSAGGSPVSEQKITVGEKVKRPADPIRNGYTFVEWTLNGNVYDFNQKVEKNISLVAVWKKNRVESTTNTTTTVSKPVVKPIERPVVQKKIYTVSFYDGDKIISTKQVEEGKLVDAPVLTKENFIFGGWRYKKDKDVYDFNTPVTCNMKLEAIWNPILEVATKVDPKEVTPDGEANQNAVDVIKKHNLVTIMKKNTLSPYSRGGKDGNWVAILLDLGIAPDTLEIECVESDGQNTRDCAFEIEPTGNDETSFIAWIDVKDDMKSSDYTFTVQNTDTVIGTISVATDYQKLDIGNGANKLPELNDGTDFDYNSQSIKLDNRNDKIVVTETRFFKNTIDNSTVGEYGIVLDLGIDPSLLSVENGTIDYTSNVLTGTEFVLKLSNNSDPKVGKEETIVFKNGLSKDDEDTLEVTIEFKPLTKIGLYYEAVGDIQIVTVDVDVTYYKDRNVFVIVGDLESFTFTDANVSKSAKNTNGVWEIVK